jgi:hypothetical protein
MYTAMLAVECMRGAAHDIWAVNTDFEYHEEQRLERDDERGGPGVAAPGGAYPVRPDERLPVSA